MHVNDALRPGARRFYVSSLSHPPSAEEIQVALDKADEKNVQLAALVMKWVEENPQRRFTMLPLPADLYRDDTLIPQAPRGVL